MVFLLKAFYRLIDMESRFNETDKEAINSSLSLASFPKDRDCIEKQRKLTSDSGFGDEINDGRDSVFSDYSSMTTSLENIAENDFNACQRNFQNDLNELIDTCQNVGITDENDAEKLSSSSADDVEQGSVNKSTKKRRVTPIPNSIKKLLKGYSLDNGRHIGKKQILFVEEEDEDDVEKYNYEDDYICQDITSYKRYTTKRNSWHGHTEDELIEGFKKRIVTLQKSKSLDRGKNFKGRRRLNRRVVSVVPACSSKEKSPLFSKLTTKDESLPGKILNRCSSMKTMSKHWEKENSLCPIRVSVEQDMPSETGLPLWMKQAEADMKSPDTSDNENYEDSEDELSTKLKIPNVNWEKLYETKNKNNEKLSNQRKVIAKQKQKEQKALQRRRKLTPSESPSHSSLEKLSNLKNSVNKLIEEDEEEEAG